VLAGETDPMERFAGIRGRTATIGQVFSLICCAVVNDPHPCIAHLSYMNQRYTPSTLLPLLYGVLCMMLVSVSTAVAQRQYNIWYFGEGAGLDFNSGSPVALTDSRMTTLEGCATIADPETGKLLFYTDGVTVWNRGHSIMDNGTGLKGHRSSTMSAAIVPMPGDSTKYYIFTADAGDYVDPPHEGFNYSIVDMRGDNGRGTISAKNIHLADTAAEKIVVIRQCGGDSYWVVTRAMRSNRFLAFKVTTTGVSTLPVVSSAGLAPAPALLSTLGYMKASVDGRRLAVGFYTHDTVEVYDFDPITGIVSNAIQIWAWSYGVAFSPDNTKLYAQSYPSPLNLTSTLYQYDISSSDPARIEASRVPITSLQGGGAMQIGPDGKIYCSIPFKSALSVIDRPNASGTACGFRWGAIDLKGPLCQFGLPNLIDAELIHDEGTAGDDATICARDTAIITASGGVRYEWSPAIGLSCTDCQSPKASPPATQRYTVRITGYVCETIDTVLVTVFPRSIIRISQPPLLCPGDSVQLLASGGTNYLWTPAEGLSCTDCAAPFASPKKTTTYTIKEDGAGDCADSTEVTVTVAEPMTVDAGESVTICGGESTQLGLTTGEGTCRWRPATGLSCTDCPNPIASPPTTTRYTVTVTGENGCHAVDTVTVTVTGTIIADAGEGGRLCPGDSLQLHASDGIAWRWSPVEGLSCSDCRSPFTSPETTTTYTVLVTTAGACTGSDSVTVVVNAPPPVDAGADRTICQGEEVQLAASPALGYRWSPATSLSCTDCQNPVARPDTTTTYYLTVTGMEGCVSTDSINVLVRNVPVVRAHIGNHSGPSGATVDIPVILDTPVPGGAVDTVIIAFDYKPDDVRSRGIDIAGTLLDGWSIRVLNEERGRLEIECAAPQGMSLSGTGELLRLKLRPFVGPASSSDLPFSLRLNTACAEVETLPGSLKLDSLCGLSYRLIEFSASKYSLSQNDPNPFNPTTRIAFSLAFDGPARLEVFDAVGNRVAVLADEQMAAGSYEAAWDAANVASGVYYYRLTSGRWSATRRMVVVK
jgi:hypothetical protein